MCGGGSGQRALEQEEKDLLRMQTQVAQQGIRGREEAMGGYRDLRQRGREMGSMANQDFEARRYWDEAAAGFGTMNRMRDARMASMGVNVGDPRFMRGRDSDAVMAVAQGAAGATEARRGVRSESLRMEGAGLAGLSGFDPSNALNSMGSTISSANNRAAQADAAESAGWGQLGSAAMYGLKNGKEIGQSLSDFGSWASSKLGFAEGGEVPNYAEGGIVRNYADGGNVYDQAYKQVGQARASGPKTTPYGQTSSGSGVDPLQAMRMAKFAVDKAAGTSFGYGAATPGMSAGSQQAAMLAQQTGDFGFAGLKATMDAGAGAMGAGAGEAALGAGAAEAAAAAAAAETAAAATAATAATEVIAPELLALLLLKDGGPVPHQKPGINRKAAGGTAVNPKGGKVSGPGGPKDDMVPAYLSPGEFVMPVGAVRKYGLDRLEKMRQDGLEFERQNGIA